MIPETSFNADTFCGTNMVEQRRYARYQVKFSATFASDHTGIKIVYDPEIGDCKVVSDFSMKSEAVPGNPGEQRRIGTPEQ